MSVQYCGSKQSMTPIQLQPCPRERPTTDCYNNYKKILIKKTMIDDGWIKIDEKYISVKTNLLKVIEFFDNLLTDISNFDTYDGSFNLYRKCMIRVAYH